METMIKAKKKSKNTLLEKTEIISNKIDVIMRNRLIIAVLLIIDGINFIVHPNNSMRDIARSVSLFVFIASITLLANNIFSKEKSVKSAIMSLLVIAFSIITYIFPQAISAYFKIILSLVITFNGILNIVHILKLDKVETYTLTIEEKIKKFIKKNNFNKDFESGIKEQTDRIMNPLNSVIQKNSKISFFSLIINIISTILGIILLIFPNITIITFGMAFIYTGLTDLLFVARSINIVKKIKEKNFKGILYGENTENDCQKEIR